MSAEEAARRLELMGHRFRADRIRRIDLVIKGQALRDALSGEMSQLREAARNLNEIADLIAADPRLK